MIISRLITTTVVFISAYASSIPSDSSIVQRSLSDIVSGKSSSNSLSVHALLGGKKHHHHHRKTHKHHYSKPNILSRPHARNHHKKKRHSHHRKSSSSSGGAPGMYAGLVKEINHVRSLHGVAPLKWSSKLASFATQWSSRCEFQHSHGQYGENLWEGSGGFTIKSMVDGWYNECSLYDYSHPDFGESTGHFTALVWKTTKHVGCHIASCGKGIGDAMPQFLSCNFDPPGNVIGQFAMNVPLPKAGGKCGPGYGSK